VDDIRTCIVCSKKAASDLLVKFTVAPDGGLVPDLLGKASGRGMHICPSTACIRGLETSKMRKAHDFIGEKITAAEIIENLHSELVARLKSLLHIARKAGLLYIGVEESIGADKNGIPVIFIASDAGSSASKLKSGRVLKNIGKADLGSLIGIQSCAALGVSSGGLIGKIEKTFIQLDSLCDSGNEH